VDIRSPIASDHNRHHLQLLAKPTVTWRKSSLCVCAYRTGNKNTALVC